MIKAYTEIFQWTVPVEWSDNQTFELNIYRDDTFITLNKNYITLTRNKKHVLKPKMFTEYMLYMNNIIKKIKYRKTVVNFATRIYSKHVYFTYTV